MSAAVKAAILTVGDELLAGDVENTNATWLATRLSDRGVEIRRILVIPDDLDLVASTIREWSNAYDAVLVTGGLGGTPDDITVEAVAQAFDLPLAVNELAREDVAATIQALREKYPDRELAINLEAEASIPQGSRPVLNEVGLSPGCVVENVYVFPGIPDEMHAMFETVAEEFGGDRTTMDAYTSLPESDLIPILEAFGEEFDVSVGSYPRRGEEANRLKLIAEDPGQLEAAHEWLSRRLEEGEV